ncbi:MAG: hypothetical protein A2677_03960 [Candidatus Komeilibacteria bacterium RIFCSPHIGHO2_01_FULL_52_14]|uniref:Uncharacterized protein n=1 Tax=Candidatus Komeilibacteria bacterium RIFCSPHIGHO2_01_FULL_52_14 TaxID=1798549 RepID=A0A1G2BKF9_9BACT|nr:MAG: hypothetical protein A2677_03960 [Candidatus Komeilibacteria bacterium RIFCSPHIGHO2_01_FULL_52_14]
MKWPKYIISFIIYLIISFVLEFYFLFGEGPVSFLKATIAESRSAIELISTLLVISIFPVFLAIFASLKWYGNKMIESGDWDAERLRQPTKQKNSHASGIYIMMGLVVLVGILVPIGIWFLYHSLAS